MSRFLPSILRSPSAPEASVNKGMLGIGAIALEGTVMVTTLGVEAASGASAGELLITLGTGVAVMIATAVAAIKADQK